MAPKLTISKLIKLSVYTNRLQKLPLYRNRPLLKPEKYNHLTKEEEDPASIPFTLILPTSLYSYKRIATISSLKRPVKRKLQD